MSQTIKQDNKINLWVGVPLSLVATLCLLGFISSFDGSFPFYDIFINLENNHDAHFKAFMAMFVALGPPLLVGIMFDAKSQGDAKVEKIGITTVFFGGMLLSMFIAGLLLRIFF